MAISSLFLSRCVTFFNFPCSPVSFPRARLTVRREVHLATRVSNLWPIRSNASAQTTPHSASSERGREKERITNGKGEIIDVVVQEKHRTSSSGKFGSPERSTPLGGVRMAAIVFQPAPLSPCLWTCAGLSYLILPSTFFNPSFPNFPLRA